MARSLIDLGFDHEAHNTLTYQISTELDNLVMPVVKVKVDVDLYSASSWTHL